MGPWWPILLLFSSRSNDSIHRYVAFHKPLLTLSSFTDDRIKSSTKHRPKRDTLCDYPFEGLHMAGRLDRDSQGLMVLTDDGHFTQYVHTRNKRYWVGVRGVPTTDVLDAARKGGLTIRGAVTQPPVSVERITPPTQVYSTRKIPQPDEWLEIVLVEGRNRQIRRMLGSLGHTVLVLVRVSIGDLELGDLQPGEWREFRKSEL